MTSRIARSVVALRSYLVLSVLVLALAAGSQAVSADVAKPADEVGASGGSSEGAGTMLEQLGLVPTNDGPGSFSMGPTLVGSGPERELVVAEDEVPTLVGSGPERELVVTEQETASGILDETERSIALIDLSGGATVAAGTIDEESQENVLIALGGAGSPTTTAGILDETSRSVDLIALTEDASFEVVQSPVFGPR